MAKLKVIAVVETSNDGILTRLEAFSTNEEAETLFTQWASERGADVNSMSDHLENGYCEAEGYVINLTWS